MKTRRAPKKSKLRRLGGAARSDIGYPSRKEYRTVKPKRKGRKTASGYLSLTTSVVEVGATPDALTWREVQGYVKRVADKARTTLARGGMVGLQINALFARLLPEIEHMDGTVEQIDPYEDGLAEFPNVGPEWEWRRWFSVPMYSNLDSIRAGLREVFMDARSMNDPPQFVFIDAIVVQKFAR